MKMKKIIAVTALISSISFASLGQAAIPGSYAGIGLGFSTIDTTKSEVFTLNGAQSGITSRTQGGLGGKLFAGYNFNRYFGLEASYTSYTRSLYKGTYNQLNSSIEYNMTAVSVVGKGYLPIRETGFNVYVLGGLAEVYNKVNFKNGGVPLAAGVATPANGTNTYHKLLPVYGVGLSYDINQHVTTNLEYSHIEGTGNVKTKYNAIPSADMLSLHVSYNFG